MNSSAPHMLFDLVSGEILPGVRYLESAFVPAGCGVIQGVFNHHLQRVQTVMIEGEQVFEVVDKGATQSEEEVSHEKEASEARLSRDALLNACDWVVLRAHEMGETIPQPWLEYRQALRDIPQQVGFPLQIDWPIRPQ